MSTKIQSPNNRLTYTGKAGPIFDTDIENLTQNLLEMVNVLLGLPSNGFAILSGFAYGSGTYGPGFVYMNGVIYYSAAVIAENKYLAPNPTDEFSKLHSDLISRYTYRVYLAIQSDTSVGGIPQFVGNMNAYRISSYLINNTLTNLINSLGDASTKDVGTASNEIPLNSDLGTASTKDVGNSLNNVPEIGALGISASQFVITSSDGLKIITYNNDTILLPKVFSIGAWNMNVSSGGTIQINIAHGIDWTKIQYPIGAMIRNDANDAKFPIYHLGNGSIAIDPTNIILRVILGGGFDSSEFASTSFSRGYVTIYHTI
jgi:hypothetical protein